MHRAPILAIDIGTTSVKGSRFELDGKRWGEVIQVRHRETGVGSQTVNIWELLDAVLSVLRRIDTEGVLRVATSCIWQTAVRIDDDGSPQAEAATWETSYTPSITDRAAARLGSNWSVQDSGAWIHPSYPLLFVAAGCSKPGERVTDVAGWILQMLTGSATGWSEPIAAGSGLWSQSSRRWSRIVDDLGWASALQAAGCFTEPIGVVRAHPALPANLHRAIWLPPLPDGLCHNLGVHGVDDAVTITVGTSGSIRTVQHTCGAVIPEGFWHYRCAERTSAIGGAISAAGNVLEWVRAFSGQQINWSFVERAEPELPCLTTEPDVFGQRGPDYPLDATGTVRGLRPTHTAQDLATAFAIDVWRCFADLFARYAAVRAPGVVRAGGGVLEQIPEASQLLADALGHPVEMPAISQPALRGAALFAAVHLRRPARIPTVDDVVDSIREASVEAAAARVLQPRRAWTTALSHRWADQLSGS